MQRADIQRGIQTLKSETGGAAKITTNPATGAARFARMSSGSEASFSRGMTGTPADKSITFLRNYGSAFGVTNPSTQLKISNQSSDLTGGQHLSYNQFYQGVPVFAGVLKTHFDAKGELRVVNGNFIPNISVNPVPSRDASSLASVAIDNVKADIDANAEVLARSAEGLLVKDSALYIYRTNLARGIPGENHLVWKYEVTNGNDVREFVYVDAHSGKVVDRITGIYDALNRRAFNGNGSTQSVPPNYPNNPFWVEGQAFPTNNVEADNMIISSKETYDYYHNAFGRDSFDGMGATMDAIFNRGNACPNASWNGTFISFCPGLTTDDVTAHEWSHAYTQYTHDLIYAHQPGALNEAYSDIHGETVDLINNRMTDSPGGLRQADAADCSEFMPYPPVVQVNSPANIANTYPSGRAVFGPDLTVAGLTSDIVRATDDANATGPTTLDGCTAFTNAAAVAGKIALVDRGTCGFKLKAYNAQQAGAIGVIIGNIASSANTNVTMADDPTVPAITIPAGQLKYADANLIRNELAVPNTVNVTLKRNAPANVDHSLRWMLGEDDTGQLPGALRDMWKPTCLGNPGKVSDSQYTCAAVAGSGNDQGGVHNNSGVVNHAYALIVDGGIYNGQTITGIGLTKAAHIYFRAQSLYQHSSSDFTDHADAIEQSATDLINAGTDLADLVTGAPSGQIVTAADLAEIQKVMLAVEMRSTHTGCAVTPLLAQNPPADACGSGTVQKTIFSDDFEGNTASWTVSHDANAPAAFTNRDWVVSSTLPDGRSGKAFWADNPDIGSCTASSNEAGVMHLTSPSIHIPSTVGNPELRFAHWVSTEKDFDGGQLMISTNGGSSFTLVPDTAFVYNAYNQALGAGTGANANPRAGQKAFSGSDNFAVDGTWGTSVVNLASLAPAGSDILLRWDLSSDCASGRLGWYVDDVKLSACLVDTDLSIVKKSSAPSTLIGNNITYTLTVRNYGPTNATSVVITDPLPTGMQFVSATGGCTEMGNVVTCNIGNLANGAIASRQITVKTTKVGMIVNTASVTQFEPDTVVPGNNSGGVSVNVLQALRSVTFTPTAVIGGCAGSTGKILLNAAAPAGGLDVTLTSGDPDVQIVGANPVHFNQGETQKTFAVTTSSVNAIKIVNVSAKVVGTTTTVIGKLKLTPVPITTVTFNPNPVTGGNQTTGTVTLSCAAPYNISVTLLSNKSAAKPQTPITILAGQTSAQFTVNTLHVLSQTAVTITAKGNGSIKTATLTVVP
ncbi:MAG TPA: M4 family metallopeptidase [Pyrinomonadaceae bacterium]